MKVAHIDCEKDTYQVLRQTITPFLNTELTKLIDGTEKVYIFFKGDSDGVKWFTSQLGKNESIPKFVSPSTNLTCPEFVYHKTCEVRVLLTGDLAFYATVLGKVNMSGRWCTWCKLSPAQWGVENHDKGELWTVPSMSSVRESIAAGDIEKMAENIKGCVNIELFDCIPIDQIIFPILHCEIGLGNYF